MSRWCVVVGVSDLEEQVSESPWWKVSGPCAFNGLGFACLLHLDSTPAKHNHAVVDGK